MGLVSKHAVWTLSLVAAISACSGSRKAASTQSVPVAELGPARPLASHGLFIPGESMRWELSLRGIVGGEATMVVGEPGVLDGRRIIITRSRTETVGLVAAIKKVEDDVITHIDVAQGVPVYDYADVTFGAKQAIIEGWFDGSRARVHYRRKGSSLRTYHLRLPGGDIVFDAHTVVGAIRGWMPRLGERAYFFVLSGRRLWHNDIVFAKRETVKTSMGSFQALRFEGVARALRPNLQRDPRKPERPFTVWLSDDAQRRPLRVTSKTEYGVVRAELTEYQVAPPAVAQRL